jgi:hypothetical protein
MFLAGMTQWSFKNETGETIPSFGVMIVTGATIVENEIVFSVKKCTQTEEDLQEPASLLFNSIQPIANDQFGVASRDFPAQALIEQSSDHTPGTIVGPKSGSFALGTVGSCLRIMAKDTTNPTVIASRGVYFIEAYHGKTDFHIARATTTITAAVGTTCGTGTAMLKRINSSNVLVDDRSVTIKNPGSVIANGALLGVWRTRNDYVAVELC